MGQLSFPASLLIEQEVEGGTADGETSFEQAIGETAQGLLSGPAIELLGTLIP